MPTVISYYLHIWSSIFSLRLVLLPLIQTNVPAFYNLSLLYAGPGFLLRRAHQISAAVFEDECKSVALTPAQFGVLNVLHASPGLDQSSLGRALSITLTDTGHSLLIQTQEPAEHAYNRLMAPLNQQQRDHLVSLLQLLTMGLEGEARAAFVPPSKEEESPKAST